MIVLGFRSDPATPRYALVMAPPIRCHCLMPLTRAGFAFRLTALKTLQRSLGCIENSSAFFMPSGDDQWSSRSVLTQGDNNAKGMASY